MIAMPSENDPTWHTLTPEVVADRLTTDVATGLSQAEAATRLQQYGRNALPAAKPPGIARVFLHQFASPLIYVLVAAALVSLVIGEWSDAGFIGAVLLLNAVIGTAQEYSAQRAATALQQLVTTQSRVLRTAGIGRSHPGRYAPACRS